MKKNNAFHSHYLLSTFLPHPNLSEDWLYFGQLSHLKTNSRKKIFFKVYNHICGLWWLEALQFSTFPDQ